MPERFRSELLTMERYTNPASFTFFYIKTDFFTLCNSLYDSFAVSTVLGFPSDRHGSERYFSVTWSFPANSSDNSASKVTSL